MNGIRRALILLIAVLVAALGIVYVWQVLPSAPLLGLIGAVVTAAVLALAMRMYRGLT